MSASRPAVGHHAIELGQHLFATAQDGAVIEIRLPASGSAALIEALMERWPPFGLDLIEVDGAPAASHPDPVQTVIVPEAAESPIWDRIESELALFTVERLQGLVAVHAAVVLVDGRAVVLPGRSHTGKSTFAVALATAGAELASDEYALVDPATGRVIGWPRPARIRAGETASRRVPVRPMDRGVPIDTVALLHFDATGQEVLDLTTPTRAEAVVAILDETVCARSRPEEALDAALRLTQARVLRGTRGEADLAALRFLDHLRQDAGAGPRPD